MWASLPLLPPYRCGPECQPSRSLMTRSKKLPQVEEYPLEAGIGDNASYPSNHPEGESLMDEVERLKELGAVDLLVQAREASIRLLLAKLNRGEISAGELAVLRNLLRDNGMVMGLDQPEDEPDEGPKIGFHLPDLSEDPDYDEDE